MIYHILPAHTYHITPQVITSIIKKTPNNHFFIILGSSGSNINWTIYDDLFNELNYTHKAFFNTSESFYKNNLIKKSAFVIIHSDSYNWQIFFHRNNFKNVHWICWGSGVDVRTNLKSLISYSFKILLYSRLKSIITLSIKDKEKLKKKFFVKNVHNIPYFESVNDIFNFTEENLRLEYKDNISVFIGNNSSAISTYLSLLHTLQIFREGILITAMLNYDLVKNDTYFNLLKAGSNIYGSNFNTDEKLYPLKDFPSYIDKCDIYICSVEEQTGLGAIYAALKLGKKIFLNGNNFDYITSLGCKVYHVNELQSLDIDSFKAPLKLEEQSNNFKIIMNVLSDDKLIEKWNSFYKQYD